MKNYSKLFLSAVCLTTLLTGCTKTEDSSNNKPSDDSSMTPSEQHDPVTLTYSAWNLGASDSETPNLDRLMIQEFQKKYPWITVNIVERPKVPGTNDDMDWNEFLTARASTNKLPDVFLADTIPTYVRNNWCRDLSDLIANDEEYQSLSQDVKDAATYDGMTMALPISIYYHGYMVNKTLYDERNGDAPTSETTWTDFIAEIKSCASHKTGGKGVVGLDGIEHIVHYYPSLLNDNYRWFTFDGEAFHLDSEEFSKTVEFYLSIYNDKTYCYNGLTPEECEDYFGTGDYLADGKVLASWQPSYNLGSMQSKIASGEWANRELDFIGVPCYDNNGTLVKKTMASMDFNAISSTTKNPEEAYLLAKWMGFSAEGYATRLELSQTVEGLDVLNFAPLLPDEELLDAFFALYPGWDEYRKVVESQSFIIEPLKYQVGYNECRYKGTYDSEDTMFTIINKILDGTTRLSDIASSLNQQINNIYQNNLPPFEEALQKYYKN